MLYSWLLVFRVREVSSITLSPGKLAALNATAVCLIFVSPGE